MSVRRLVPLVLLLAGCFVQGGVLGGAALRERSAASASWGGNAVVAADQGMHLGLELEGRAERGHGSTFHSGLQLGFATGDNLSPVRFGAHVDPGFALAWSAAHTLYLGGTLELPVRLASDPPITERNRNFRLIGGAPWLVPFLRYRYYSLRGTPNDVHDISSGIALRMSYTSDLM